MLIFLSLYIAGSDYTTTANNISFEAGFFVTTVEVPIVVDRVAEGEEIFYGTLTTLGDANVLITESRANVHISDNDSMLQNFPTACINPANIF